MSKHQPRAIALYAMDHKYWDSSFRDELMKGEDSYKTWFLEHAKEIHLEDSIYEEVFLTNPIIKTGITNTLLEESHHQFSEANSSDLIYFVLNPDPYLMLVESTQYSPYITPAVKSFTKILQDIAEEKIFVIAEYNKKQGWFDYDKLSREKHEFKRKHELELRQIESRLNKK